MPILTVSSPIESGLKFFEVPFSELKSSVIDERTDGIAFIISTAILQHAVAWCRVGVVTPVRVVLMGRFCPELE